MARTKQTARKTLVGKAPRSFIAHKSVRKGAGSSVAEKPDADQLQDFVNTQQFSLKFDDQDKCQKQAEQKELYSCKNCQAYFTIQSSTLTKSQYKLKKQNSTLSDIQRQKYLQKYQKVWICQFCLSHNSIPQKYSPPKQQNPCIILKKQTVTSQKQEGNEKILIFCVDISGSMDMSFEGKTRLQSVKQAILDQVNRLKYEKQKIKIGLISFGNQVNLIGDGSVFKHKILPTNLYNNFEGAIKQLQGIKNFCIPLQKSYQSIKKTISGLSVHGSTALGPGLLSAVQIASKGSVGSKVILCTDGEANVGMGSFHSDDRLTFYSKMAEHAKNRKVMVSILSLKGDKCNLKQLGKLSLATGGSILKIDPKMLGTQFKKIVKQNVIGTESKLVVKVNKIFKICNAKPQQLSKDQTTMTQDFGNFTQQTQLNFQFDTIPKQTAEKMPEIDKNLYKLKRVPMQIHLTYTGRNNWRYLQIVTDWRELTQNLNDIYQGANFALFAASVLQRTSNKIRQGKFSQADNIITGYWSIVKQKFQKSQNPLQLNKFAERVKKLQKILVSRMKKTNSDYLQKFKSKNKNRQSSAIERGRGRGRGGGSGGIKSKNQRSRSRSRSASLMSSDSQNQVLYKQIRARQRSRSRQKSRQKSSESQSSMQNKKNKRKQIPSRSRQKNSKNTLKK